MLSIDAVTSHTAAAGQTATRLDHTRVISLSLSLTLCQYNHLQSLIGADFSTAFD